MTEPHRLMVTRRTGLSLVEAVAVADHIRLVPPVVLAELVVQPMLGGRGAEAWEAAPAARQPPQWTPCCADL